MLQDDELLLESLERVFRILQAEAGNLKRIKSIHGEKIRELEKEIRSHARMVEEISLPARLILEHILELKSQNGQMAVEAENIDHSFSNITNVAVEQFGLIKISTGNLQLTWRDDVYNYFIYPDKVELRTTDEKTMIRLFFSHNFGRQMLHKFSRVLDHPKLLYIHPVIQKNLESRR